MQRRAGRPTTDASSSGDGFGSTIPTASHSASPLGLTQPQSGSASLAHLAREQSTSSVRSAPARQVRCASWHQCHIGAGPCTECAVSPGNNKTYAQASLHHLCNVPKLHCACQHQ